MGPCDYISTAFTSFSARPLENTRSHAQGSRSRGAQARCRNVRETMCSFLYNRDRHWQMDRHYLDRWPHDGPCSPDEVALLLIDFQKDFCHPDGYLAKVGGDLKPAHNSCEESDACT